MFGRKVALALRSVDWKLKELAIKVIWKQTEKSLQSSNSYLDVDISELGEASMTAVGLTSREKVIKVFNISL